MPPLFPPRDPRKIVAISMNEIEITFRILPGEGGSASRQRRTVAVGGGGAQSRGRREDALPPPPRNPCDARGGGGGVGPANKLLVLLGPE